MEEQYVRGVLEKLKSPGDSILLLGSVIASLLTLDLFFPIPSGILMFYSGFYTGFFWGFVINFAGAMGSALIGFGLCRKFGMKAFEKITGKKEIKRVEHIFESYGVWAILLSRSVPMLTEIISALAGLAKISFKRFFFFTTVGTIPVCLVYAYIGSLKYDNIKQMGWSVLVALVLPAIGYGILNLTMLRRNS